MLPTQPKSKKRTSKLGFGKSPKPSGAATGTSKSPFKSRFADSSDEDDDRPRRFQSRFVDSDSEEEFELPKGLTPVRGIPRRQGEEDGDSTDLEDEASDTEKDAKRTEAGVTNGATGSAKDAAFAPTSLLESKHAPQTPTFESVKPKTKRGFLGLGKKKTSPKTPEQGSNQLQTDPTIPPPPQPKNRPLTPIGEDETSPSPARAPKLLRRRTPQWGRSASDTWPLPQNQTSTAPDDARPQTADGPSRASMRPSLTKRFSSAGSQASTSVDPTVKDGDVSMTGRTGKKKKFPKMRRFFGLDN
jgi:hypothetical protein